MENLELVFLHDWSVSRIKFARIDDSARQAMLADPVGSDSDFFAMDSFEPHPRYFVENSLDLLDARGEWFLDESRGILSYKPFDNEKPESLEAFAPSLDSLIVVRGDAEANRPRQKISFENLVFEHCRWTPPSHGYAESQATSYTLCDSPAKESELMPAAITFDQAANCLIRNCTLRHLGGSGFGSAESASAIGSNSARSRMCPATASISAKHSLASSETRMERWGMRFRGGIV